MLNEKRVGRERTAALLAGRERLLRQTLRVVQAAVHQCAHRFEQKSALKSIAQLRLDGQILVLRDIGDYIARFDQIGDPKEAGLEREVSLPGPICDCDQFLRVGQPLFEAVRVSQRKPASPKGDDQGMRILSLLAISAACSHSVTACSRSDQ